MKCTGNVPTWYVYNIEFKDGTWKRYNSKDSNTIVAHIYNNFKLNKLPYTKFTHKMNNFTYEIDVDINNIKWDTHDVQVIGTQRNTETNVIREIRIVRNEKPKQKTIENYVFWLERILTLRTRRTAGA